MRALDYRPSSAVYRYFLSRGMVYRLQPVDSLRLAEHGWASIEGSAELQRLRREHAEERDRIEARARGASGEELEADLAMLRDARKRQAEELEEHLNASLERQRDAEARQRAYVCASVCGMGVIRPEGWDTEKDGPFELFCGLMPPDWAPTEDTVRNLGEDGEVVLIETWTVAPEAVCRQGETVVDAVRRHNQARQLVYGADFNKTERRLIFFAARSMADGRARRAASFRIPRPEAQGADPSPRGGEREDCDRGAGDAA